MTTKPLTNVTIKDGKIVRKRKYRAKNREIKAAREVRAWEAKSKK
jgi:predicted DNA-binding antitoxin AbrB/MazE fold protein